MKKQSKSSKLDESLGMRRGKESTKKQSMKDRRDESRGSKKKMKHSDEKQDIALIKKIVKSKDLKRK